MSGEQVPDWVTAGAMVLVTRSSSSRSSGVLVHRMEITKVLARDVVMKGRTDSEIRVHREHFTDDGMGGFFHRRERHDTWHSTTTEVFPHDHPRALAVDAARRADRALAELKAEVEDLTLLRNSGGPYPTGPRSGPLTVTTRVAGIHARSGTLASLMDKARLAALWLQDLNSMSKDERAAALAERKYWRDRTAAANASTQTPS